MRGWLGTIAAQVSVDVGQVGPRQAERVVVALPEFAQLWGRMLRPASAVDPLLWPGV